MTAERRVTAPRRARKGKPPRRKVCPAWPKCACILRGEKDVDCEWPYGSIPGYPTITGAQRP